MIRERALAYAQLMRLPNVFTAFADICMAAAITGAMTQATIAFVLVLATSGCLYIAGMIWNDIFDRHEDAKTQAFRPIPSGRVRVGTAIILSSMLTACGLGFAGIANSIIDSNRGFFQPLPIAITLTAAILLYDVWLKWTPIGPIAMGSCRFLNVLLGLSILPMTLPGNDSTIPILHIASVVGIYIVGVTWFARVEEGQSQPSQLTGAATIMAFALVIALLLPIHMNPASTNWYSAIFIVIFGFHIGIPITVAIRNPEPKSVQRAVKRCILGLVLLDAVVATTFVGWPGLAIGLLLIPARILGKWVYST